MSSSTWVEQFEQSMEAHPELFYDRNRVVQTFSSGDDNSLFMAGYNALAQKYVEKSLGHLERLYSLTESPIEQAMLYALCVAAHDRATNVRFIYKGITFGDFDEEPDVLTIEPQAKLGDYRVDFLLHYEESLPDFENTRTAGGQKIPGVTRSRSHLIVECDGHDFHDRSKEQASRDRKRDRELGKIGYPVFRYTGSDIWKDVGTHAWEAVDSLCSAVWNHANAGANDESAPKSGSFLRSLDNDHD